jgi:hypothetical protein
MGFSETDVLHPTLDKQRIAIAKIAVAESGFRKMEEWGPCGAAFQN